MFYDGLLVAMDMEQSTVKWFDAKKGYGFINHPDGGEDVFVHYSQIESGDDFKTLHTDQPVEFELNDGPKGLHALNVRAQDDVNSGDGEAASAPPSDELSVSQDASTPVESSL